MEKLTKYKKHILMIALLIIGIIAIIFGKTPRIQGGVSCLCLGLAVLTVVWINKQRQDQEVIDFEIQAKEILEDIALLGEDSEYYSYYDINAINNLRAKMLKQHKRQTISCAILGVVLIIIAIICMF